jgi:hypothetical protein
MVGDDLLSRDYESRIFRGRLDRLPNVLIDNARPLRTEPFVVRAFQIELPGSYFWMAREKDQISEGVWIAPARRRLPVLKPPSPNSARSVVAKQGMPTRSCHLSLPVRRQPAKLAPRLMAPAQTRSSFGPYASPSLSCRRSQDQRVLGSMSWSIAFYL